MANAILESIKDFYNLGIFFITVGVGLFGLFVDYPYFKKLKYKKDKSITLIISILYIVLAVALLIISNM